MFEAERVQVTIPVKLAFTHSIKKAKKLLRRYGCDGKSLDGSTGYAATTLGCTNESSGDSFYIVYMKPNTSYPAWEDAEILAHEAAHVASGYFEDIGEESPSEEFRAYVTGSIAGYLNRKHWKWKRKRLADS